MEQFRPTNHEDKLLRYLHQQGPKERRTILVDYCSDDSMIALRSRGGSGPRFINGSNGAAPMIVARWMRRLIERKLVRETRSNDRFHQHMDYRLTPNGEAFVRSGMRLPGLHRETRTRRNGMTSEARTKCFVPHCRRTRPAYPTEPEWLCQKHWGAIPRDARRAYSRAKRRGKSPHALARLWRLLSRRAVEAAFLDPLL